MSTKLTDQGANQRQDAKKEVTKASWQPQKVSAMTKPKDGSASLTPQTVLIVPSEDELKELAARLQDLMRSWQSPRPMITADYLIIAFPIRGNKIGVISGGHGSVFTVNDDPVTPVMAEDAS